MSNKNDYLPPKKVSLFKRRKEEIIVGVIVTSNLIYSIYLIDINKIIISSILYWCYSYVLRYMYSPIGKYKILSKYLLPIFLVLYLFFRVLNIVKNISMRNKKVQAS